MSTISTTLANDSVDVIVRGQAPSGAYVASPTFSQYGFGWLRDGSYVAMAMDAVGQEDSARRFHTWVAGVMRSRREQIEHIVASLGSGSPVEHEHMLPTRYTLEGALEGAGEEDWPNFQLDGYGTWLFGLHSHLGGVAGPEWADAVRLAVDYLTASWHLPCYDYWEEFGDRQHASTLASIAAGLMAAGELLDDDTVRATGARVREYLLETCVVDGSFVKGPEDSRVDASLVSISTPFNLVAPNDPIMQRTIERIRTELSSPSGGIRRYVGDTYYGGSPWILLTAWFGWHARRAGDEQLATHCREWVEARAHGEASWLAEQDLTEPQAPDYIAEWEERWGPVADPLLWSHAKYLLLLEGPGA